MSKIFVCFIIQLSLLCTSGNSSKSINEENSHLVLEGSRILAKSLDLKSNGQSLQCAANATNGVCDVQPKSTAEDGAQRLRRNAFLRSAEIKAGFNITGVFWDDVWKSSDVKWVEKRVDDNDIRPSDRQFFHILIPNTIFSLYDTCINLDQKDERDFTLLADISWKDQNPSLRYPPVPEQCTFGRSSGFLCVLLDDGNSCHYVSGWGQDRVQAVVDGRRSNCGHRQHLHMMLHALGLMHEYDRGDALKFVSLHPRLRILAGSNNPVEYRIPQDDCSLFRQNTSSLPFDFASIMLHDGSFQSDSAKMDFELPLIPKHSRDVRELLAHRGPGLSHFDRLKLRYLYGCQSKNCPPARPCENMGFRNKLCRCECAPGYAGKRCEVIRKPPKDPCLRTVTHTTSFTLNSTKCRPVSQQAFNFTTVLTGDKTSRFVIIVDMTSLRAIFETLRLLPNCEHARLYFAGTGQARPQVMCAERLVLSPVTLRSTYSSGMLLLLMKLPNTPRDSGRPDPAIAAISAIHINIASEPSPTSELQVDTSPPPPPSTTSTTGTATTTPATPEPSSTASPLTATPQPTPPPLTPPTTRRPDLPPTFKTRLPALPSITLGEEQPAAGGAGWTAGILAIIIVLVLVTTVVLLVFMLRFRQHQEEEAKVEDLQAGNQEMQEFATFSGDYGQQ